MKKIIVFLFSVVFTNAMLAQSIFLTKGEVEYEVKTNFKKTLGNSFWAERMADNLPEFKTGYYKLTFANNASIYKWDHWDAKAKLPVWMTQDDEQNVWFTSITEDKQQKDKHVFGSEFHIQDSLLKINWKLTNEMREIAGFNCRKAVGVFNDSVYVFAFFTNEIAFSGGPVSLNGLPGLILGVSIPRLYTSWMATKVKTSGFNEAEIKPLTMKKPLTNAKIMAVFEEQMKDWWDDEEGESAKQKAIMKWNLRL